MRLRNVRRKVQQSNLVLPVHDHHADLLLNKPVQDRLPGVRVKDPVVLDLVSVQHARRGGVAA